MYKILLLIAGMFFATSVMANDGDTPEVPEVPEAPETVIVRTGTCGATQVEQGCNSVGINIKTGEVVMIDDGRDVWSEDAVVVGRLTTYADHELLAGSVSANTADIDSLYSFTGASRSMIADNSSRIDFNGMAIGRLQSDIDRLDGQAAAQVAASSAIMPRDWDGRFAMTFGVGTYRGKIGAAIGIMHDSGSWAVKAQVTGTDADDWSSLAVGASVGFAF